MQAIDLQFAPLYQYIESRYAEDEFIVTMFDDHGQTYFLRPEDHHPGDPYMAAIHAPSHTLYCTSEQILSPQCRLAQGTLHMLLKNQDGRPIHDPQLMQKYTSIINERLKYIYLY